MAPRSTGSGRSCASTPCWSAKASRVISSTRSRTPGRGFQTRRPSATAPSMSSASSSASSFSRKETISGDHSRVVAVAVGRGQQGQPVDALGRLGRQLQRDPAAERGAHEGGAPDPQVVEHAQEVVGVGVLARRQRRAPVAAQVGDVQAHAVDALGQRVPHAPVDAARVDEDDVRRRGGCARASCLRRQLAARGVDVAPAREAHGRADPVLLERRPGRRRSPRGWSRRTSRSGCRG